MTLLVVGSDRMARRDLRSGGTAGLRGQGPWQEGGYSFCLCHTAVTFKWERGRGVKDPGLIASGFSQKKATGSTCLLRRTFSLFSFVVPLFKSAAHDFEYESIVKSCFDSLESILLSL